MFKGSNQVSGTCELLSVVHLQHDGVCVTNCNHPVASVGCHVAVGVCKRQVVRRDAKHNARCLRRGQVHALVVAQLLTRRTDRSELAAGVIETDLSNRCIV